MHKNVVQRYKQQYADELDCRFRILRPPLVVVLVYSSLLYSKRLRYILIIQFQVCYFIKYNCYYIYIILPLVHLLPQEITLFMFKTVVVSLV